MLLIPSLRRAWDQIRRFGADRRGNVALIAAVMLLPISMAFGMAVDYGMQSTRQDRLQGAADAAALAAVTPNMMAASAATAQTNAQQMWNAQSGQISGVSTLNGVVSVVDSAGSSGGTTRNVTVTYTGKSSTIFSGLIGFNTLPISGTSTSTMSSTPYLNIYVLIDNSQSMGIASTTTDMANLWNVTKKYNPQGCVFGCHVPEKENLGETYSDEYLAHKYGVTLRIDSAKSAITTMLSQATSQNMSNYVKFALYTMGGGDASDSTLLNKVASLSNNYSSLTTSVSNIDLEASALGVIGDTDIEDAIAALQATLPTSNGNGSSASNPMNFVFVVTDGLDDFDIYNKNLPCLNNAPSPGGYRCTQALIDTTCTKLQKSANIGVIYTPYLPIYNTSTTVSSGYYSSYSSLVQPFASTIATNLQNCASSSSYYMVASDGPSIISAMTKLFNQALETAHLTS